MSVTAFSCSLAFGCVANSFRVFRLVVFDVTDGFVFVASLFGCVWFLDCELGFRQSGFSRVSSENSLFLGFLVSWSCLSVLSQCLGGNIFGGVWGVFFVLFFVLSVQ